MFQQTVLPKVRKLRHRQLHMISAMIDQRNQLDDPDLIVNKPLPQMTWQALWQADSIIFSQCEHLRIPPDSLSSQEQFSYENAKDNRLLAQTQQIVSSKCSPQ
jgi:hypothetical protein